MRHVFDLPQLYAQPSAVLILSALQDLAIRPVTFEGSHDDDLGPTPVGEDGLPRYLTGIISSQLAWIEDDELREQIWEAASQRLSGRAGRTAQPTFERVFSIPLPNSDNQSFEIRLLEPSMTEDNLGHKTWASAYLLAKRLALLLDKIPAFTTKLTIGIATPGPSPPLSLPRILELGAGTGLSGLALSFLAPCAIDLTDLPSIVPNLNTNITINASSLAEHQSLSTVLAFPLDWAKLPAFPLSEAEKYELVLAADPLYSPEHPELVCGAVDAYLRRGKDARLVIELPLRESFETEREALWKGLGRKGLKLKASGEETGFDDWGDGTAEVRCWWGIWAWT